MTVALTNSTNHVLAIGKDGKVQKLQYSGLSGILPHHPAPGTLIHANHFNSRGNGVYVCKAAEEPKSKLCAVLATQAGGNILAEWKGSDWEIPVVNSVSALDSNRLGDLLFQQSNGGNSILMVRPADATDNIRQLIHLFQPTAEGDYLTGVYAMDFRDDWTVYFLAMTPDDETVLYETKPVN